MLGVHCYSGLEFPCADTVLVEVVGVGFCDIECVVGIIFPAAAEIQNIVYSAYLVVTRECEAKGIVFAVACVGHMDFSEQGGVECSGSAKAIDAKCVVAAILGGPFFVVDDAGGEWYSC